MPTCLGFDGPGFVSPSFDREPTVSQLGTKVPWGGTFVPWNFRPRELSFLGTKLPGEYVIISVLTDI